MSAKDPKKLRTISVLIPTWRRPDELSACLVALGRQTVRPDQIVLTVRSDDDVTRAQLAALGSDGQLPAGLDVVDVDPVPLTAAMNEGLARTTGDIVALTDDDAAPWPGWLEQCRRVLIVEPSVAGVGGRDWQPHDRRSVERVGLVSWYGRVIGNHHLGVGPARDVDVLKGVNAVFRGDLIRSIGFDRRLRGRGNVSHWEMSLCLRLRRDGWRLVYDPAIAVDHRPAVRHDGDLNARGGFDAQSHLDGVHNETVAVLAYLSLPGRWAFLTWAVVVGTSGAPGIGQTVRLLFRRLLSGGARSWATSNITARWWASLRGRLAGWRTSLTSKRVP